MGYYSLNENGILIEAQLVAFLQEILQLDVRSNSHTHQKLICLGKINDVNTYLLMKVTHNFVTLPSNTDGIAFKDINSFVSEAQNVFKLNNQITSINSTLLSLLPFSSNSRKYPLYQSKDYKILPTKNGSAQFELVNPKEKRLISKIAGWGEVMGVALDTTLTWIPESQMELASIIRI